MPPICSFCKEIGHSLKRCSRAPITCKACNSSGHNMETCPKGTSQLSKGKKTRRGRSKSKQRVTLEYRAIPNQPSIQVSDSPVCLLGSGKDFVQGETSSSKPAIPNEQGKDIIASRKSSCTSDAEHDSSDVQSAESDLEEGELVVEKMWKTVQSKKKQTGTKEVRGKGPKSA
ncbi:uncharacterized protein LOC112085184 [Eutrema salsugineum]|uniref:uncharacterized protein LOC112085184 n=1 Tax=Eutrema salsugineum TaxID=72664 RepID=UPI000CED3940|nr:uncharacterized protein LOC112085184 [Eutrema salsugineum]